MDEADIIRYITETFEGVDVVTASGVTFFFYDPDQKFPFATIVTQDNAYDHASNLNRPAVFRLNLGIGRGAYRSMFGPQPPRPGASGVVETGHDFAALDVIMPHPVYAMMSWVCVLNPSEATFRAVRPLLAEAYDLDVKKHARRRNRG